MHQVRSTLTRFSKILVASMLLSNQLLAQELKWTHYGVRPLAMGNAFVAVADDYNAMFYNPAGLARLSTWSLEIMNPKVGISTATIATINDVNKLATGGSSSASGKNSTQVALNTFETLSGKPQYVSLGMTPHLVFPGFGLGAGIDVGGSLVIHRQISAHVDIGLDAIVPLTFAKNFLEDRLSLGATAKAVFRTGVDSEFVLADIFALAKDESDSSGKKLNDYVQSGRGFGADLGMLYTPTKSMEPTFGVSLMDVGGTPLKASSDTFGKPEPRPPTLNTGFSFKPYTSNNLYLLTAVDVHAANQPIHYSKKVNFGSEFGVGKIFKLQAGLHQGEFSGGFQFDAWLLVLRFATYAEQLGTTAGQDKLLADRRYVMQLKLLL
jgi:hypothetical protein